MATVRVTATGDARLEDGPSLLAKDAPRPPELRSFRLSLPLCIDEAATVLARAGIALDPRRIDVYQCGSLLCRLLCGEEPSTYLRSPRCKAKVPPALQPLLDHALGHNPQERFLTLAQFLSAVAANPVNRDAQTTPYPSPPPESATIERPSLSDGDRLPFTRLGPYAIQARLGSGGMGEVYKGHDPRLDRTVAIKVLPDVFARFPELVERFHAEAGAAARLVHPNIIPIYFIGEESGFHFFAMQYVEGESLAERLARRKRLSIEETLALGEQCVAGLAAAHRAGLVHRDIKPGNILIQRHTGRALLADFGLVKVLDAPTRGTATGMVLGTIDYIAPEQARGLPVDGRADLYALGVVLYEALSGRLPFPPAAATARLFQHAFETPIPLRQVAPEIPTLLATLIDRLLSKQPEQRTADADALLAELRALRAGDSVSAVIRAPTFGPLPPLPLVAESAHRGWRQILWDGARSLLRRQAPEVLARLQNTQQQVDGAVAEYQRRRDQLAAWLREARMVADELGEQARARRALAANAAMDEDERKEAEEFAAELERQQADQREQAAEMELQLARVESMLLRLRAQRDALNARLRVAEARAVLAGNRPRLHPSIAAVLALLLLLAVAGWYLARPGVSGDPLAEQKEAETPPPSIPPIAPQESADESKSSDPPGLVRNSIGMRFVRIPTGRFEMGNHEPLASADPQAARDAEDQYPLHEIFLSKDFWMSVTEVTQAQFERVMGYNPSSLRRGRDATAEKNTQRFPVTDVTWYDAMKFCRELSYLPAEREAGRRYRLPTEAEWEYACHGPGERKTRFAFGDEEKQLPLYAYLHGNRAPRHSEVARRKPNAFGLYDMYGNAAEWCLDRYLPNYYAKLAGTLAVDPAGPRDGIHRVVRGGGPSYRSSARGHVQPNVHGEGFRVLFGGVDINDP